MVAALALVAAAAAQEQSKPAEQQGPPVRLNIMNVCTPSPAEQQEITAALNHIPIRPRLAPDFEVARGHTTMDNANAARWVRVRHDFPNESPYSNVQYSFSDDDQRLAETLVLRRREVKDIVQVSIEDAVTASNSAASLLSTNTPANRIKVERFGKPSLGLDRCPNADQSAYEPIFRKASQVMSAYRATLQVRSVVPPELARLKPRAASGAAKPKK